MHVHLYLTCIFVMVLIVLDFSRSQRPHPLQKSTNPSSDCPGFEGASASTTVPHTLPNKKVKVSCSRSTNNVKNLNQNLKFQISRSRRLFTATFLFNFLVLKWLEYFRFFTLFVRRKHNTLTLLRKMRRAIMDTDTPPSQTVRTEANQLL